MEKNQKLLTEVELELMNVIWDLGDATVRQVVDVLPKKRSLAYTSVATFMKILEKKKVLRSKSVDRALRYFPLLSRDEYESRSVGHLLDNVFKGTPSALVARLIEDASFSHEDLAMIRKVLREKEARK